MKHLTLYYKIQNMCYSSKQRNRRKPKNERLQHARTFWTKISHKQKAKPIGVCMQFSKRVNYRLLNLKREQKSSILKNLRHRILLKMYLYNIFTYIGIYLFKT